jgi:peptide-methionine (S)-S-oxide reductase
MLLSEKIALGGGCHWCTEGVFTSLQGVIQINQGWITSIGSNSQYSEAIEVLFDTNIISLKDLVSIHLHTHACTADHSMRNKYRSAVYVYSDVQGEQAQSILQELQSGFTQSIVTKVLPFAAFKANKAELTDYLYTSPNRPFCQRYIHPKLQVLMQRFSQHVNTDKLIDAGIEVLK